MRIYKKAKTRGGKNYDDIDVKRREEQNFFNSDRLNFNCSKS